MNNSDTIVSNSILESETSIASEGDQYSIDHLDARYYRFLTRLARFTLLVEKSAPEIILRNEKRILQDAIDDLYQFDGADAHMGELGFSFFQSLLDVAVGDVADVKTNAALATSDILIGKTTTTATEFSSVYVN